MRSEMTLSSETLDALRWTASLGAVTADALAAHQGVAPSSASARLGAAERAGLMDRCRPLHGQAALHLPTRKGLHLVGMAAGGVCRVTPGNALHLIACARVAAAMEDRHRDHRVEGERGLRRAEHDHGRPLASATVAVGPDGHPRLHRPDLVLWPRQPDHGLPVAVEIELTIKAPRRLLALCRAWARCREVGGVLYCAPPEVARAVDRAVARTRAAERIIVLDLDEVTTAARVVSPSAARRRRRAAEPSQAPPSFA